MLERLGRYREAIGKLVKVMGLASLPSSDRNLQWSIIGMLR